MKRRILTGTAAILLLAVSVLIVGCSGTFVDPGHTDIGTGSSGDSGGSGTDGSSDTSGGGDEVAPPPASGGTGGGSGLTITGITGTWNVYATTTNPTTAMDFANLVTMNAGMGLIGTALSTGNKVYWNIEPSDGTYTIVIANAVPTIKKAVGVQIPGSVSYDSFITISP
jgi:hypothetical protein